jgi:hypothetical protein
LSSDTFSGATLSVITNTHLYPRWAATMASPTPVLPLVGSTMVPPGRNSPSRSAARIISSAGRSLDDPPGLVVSAFSASTHSMPWSSLTRFMRTSGVLPIRSMTESAISVPARRGSLMGAPPS